MHTKQKHGTWGQNCLAQGGRGAQGIVGARFTSFVEVAIKKKKRWSDGSVFVFLCTSVKEALEEHYLPFY